MADDPANGVGPPLGKLRSSARVIPHRAPWWAAPGALLVWSLIRGVDATLRYRMEGPADALETARQHPVIFAIWHNRLALSLMLYRRYVRADHPGRRMAGLVSASRDGGMLARVLETFGVQPVRGSSSRRGPQALLEMTSWAERGYDLAITPDGPRGPRYVVQDGIVSLAQLTGLPIVPVSYDLQWKRCANSWDRFQIPLPFSSCTVRFGELLRVPREGTEAERAGLRQQLEARLRAITSS